MISPILSVKDIDASIKFYVKGLGFTENWCMRDDNQKATFACVKLSSAEILLGTIDFVEPENRNKCGIGVQIYIEIPVDMDIEEIYVKAQQYKTNITRAIENREWGERAFNIKDVDGYQLMLAQRINPAK